MSGPRFADTHVVVTGAAGGIGAALAIGFATEGATVSCVDLDADGAEKTIGRVVESGGRAVAVAADLTDPVAVEGAADTAERAHGPVDVLVACAGGARGERIGFLEMTPEHWHRMLDRNATAGFLCGSVFGRRFANRGHGAIVYITSQAAEVVHPGLVHYSAAKGALRQLVRGMALELAPHGVRVNAVAPGVVRTAANAAPLDGPEGARLASGVPLGRFAEPGEIVGAALHLASAEASYTTGATILVDGGFTLT